MGKICDPSTFTGGQCSGGYKLQIGVIYQRGGILGYYCEQNSSATRLSDLQVLSLGITFPSPIFSMEFKPQSIGSNVWQFFINGIGSNIRAGNDGNNFVQGYQLISLLRANGQADTCGNPPPTNCRCTPDSCRVDCAGAPDGFCCIDHAVTNRLLQILQN